LAESLKPSLYARSTTLTLEVAERESKKEEDKRLNSKLVSESQTEVIQVVQPEDTNPMGVAFGGKVMQWMDLAGAVAATRHARRPVVTASVDHLSFLAPIHVGDFVIIKAAVNYAGTTSMEVGVSIESEDPHTGQRHHTLSGYLTFVALDGRGKPTPIPKVVPTTDQEKQRYEEARRRRQLKLQWRAEELI
jgi:acyl-CoA hydrolase